MMFEVLKSLKVTVMYDVTSSSLVDMYRCFCGNCCLHPQSVFLH